MGKLREPSHPSQSCLLAAEAARAPVGRHHGVEIPVLEPPQAKSRPDNQDHENQVNKVGKISSIIMIIKGLGKLTDPV